MKYSNRRLRLLFWHTPWFFVTCFYWPRYGDSWFLFEIFEPVSPKPKWCWAKPGWEEVRETLKKFRV